MRAHTRLLEYAQSPNSIADQARMLLYKDSKSFRKLVVLVEGKTDESLLSKVLAKDKVDFVNCSGKESLIGSIFELAGTVDLKFLRAFADIDYDLISGRKLVLQEKIFYIHSGSFVCNDFDAVMYTLYGQMVVEDLLGKYQNNAVSCADIFRQIVYNSKKIGALRLAFLHFNIRGVKLNDLVEFFISDLGFKCVEDFDLGSLIDFFVKNLELFNSIASCELRTFIDFQLDCSDDWSLIRGHDISTFIAVAWRASNDLVRTRRSVETALRNYLDLTPHIFWQGDIGRSIKEDISMVYLNYSE